MCENNLKVCSLPKKQWNDILHLTVACNQKNFIESSQKCLDDAEKNAYNMNWNFYGIFAECSLIGFAMYGKQEFTFCNSKIWLDRFMIDEKYQGKSYGKKSLIHIIKLLLKEYNCNKIYLSVHEENALAITLYEKIGFKKTFFKDEKGERVMVLKSHKFL